MDFLPPGRLVAIIKLIGIAGVVTTVVLLLSIAVSEKTPSSSASDGVNATPSAETEETESVQLMQLPFVSNLTNPCSSENSSKRPAYVAGTGHRASFSGEFFRFISHYAKNYKEDAREVLQNHTINGCETLQVTNLPDTPTLEDLQEMDTEEALNRIYSSLLKHSAYAYFIHYQFITSNSQCSEDIEGEQSLASESLQLALKQKSLACYIRVGISVLGYELEEWSLADETVTDLTRCSRRALRDCQVISSIVNFLRVLKGYSDELS